jgi:hypothetical protein
MRDADRDRKDYQSTMLCKHYIEALLADADRADAVWQDWYDGKISDSEAAQAWLETAVEHRASGSASAPSPQRPQNGAIGKGQPRSSDIFSARRLSQAVSESE